MKRICLVLFLFVGVYIYAQQKYALVIGNSDYTGISKLSNPVNDANDMAMALKDLGFTVEIVMNGNLEQMETAAMNFRRGLSASRDIFGFFFFAGHGVQSNGDNYLIPVDAGNILSESHLRQRAFSVQTLLDNLNDARNELNMIVLDACRDNPFGWARSSSRGLSMLSSAPAGSIIMYATSANSTAADGTGRNGLFTSQLLKNLQTPGLSVRDIFDKTGEDVLRISSGSQHPELSIRYFGASSAFLGSQSDVSAVTVQPAPQSAPQPAVTQEPAPSHFPADLLGTWVHSDTVIVITPDSFSVSWPQPDGVSYGYTISPISFITVTNTTGRNQRYQHGYRIFGKIISTNVSTMNIGDNIDRSYFFDANKHSFWNSGSSTSVIYQKQLNF